MQHSKAHGKYMMTAIWNVVRNQSFHYTWLCIQSVEYISICHVNWIRNLPVPYTRNFIISIDILLRKMEVWECCCRVVCGWIWNSHEFHFYFTYTVYKFYEIIHTSPSSPYTYPLLFFTISENQVLICSLFTLNRLYIIV